MKIAIAVAVLVVLAGALAGPALAQTTNQGRADTQGQVERVETPQGTVTIMRPAPLAQPATPGPPAAPTPNINFDPVPPPPATPFLGNQTGNECWQRPCVDR
jgi:hypothetical protein